jgi:triphosphatase
MGRQVVVDAVTGEAVSAGPAGPLPGSPFQEIELKLALDPADLNRLTRSPALTAAGPARSRTLVSRYFDTVDHRLRQAGLALRVRESGRRFVQTLKSAPESTGGVSIRGEWESPVSGPLPELARLPAASLLDGLSGVNPGDLLALFESRIKRSQRLLFLPDGSHIEIAVDRGDIVCHDGETLPVCEVELELKPGAAAPDVGALYDLALALNETVPLRLERQSKSDRGYGLAGAPVPGWGKAGRVLLSPDDTIDTALTRMLRLGLSHLAANEATALQGIQPEGVHQLRVALRRLRAVLAGFRPLLPPGMAEPLTALTAELKWLAGSLGPARDWDVFLTETLPPLQMACPDESGLADLLELARGERTRGYQQVREALTSRRCTALLLTLAAWADGRRWRVGADASSLDALDRPVRPFAYMLLQKRHRQARRRGQRLAALALPARHELRLALKKLRYAGELFRSLYPEKPTERYMQRLSALQDRLGAIQDVVSISTAISRCADAVAAGRGEPGLWRQGAGLVLGWHRRGVQDSEDDLLADWTTFAGTRPFWQGPATGDRG